MPNETVLLFGASGGIGSAVYNTLNICGYSVVSITKEQVNFTSDCQLQVDKLLVDIRPSIVINCAGIFGNNTDNWHNIMAVNFGSNWNLIQHYMTNASTHPVRIIMLGSISYKQGQKWSMVYSASKSAVFSLWQAAKEYFAGSVITVDLVNPQRTRTAMTESRYNPNLPYHDPQEVADEILALIKSNGNSSCINMTFKNVNK
jgi:short-subunit dehydrogenase